jgi:hypothetical protein
MLSFARLVADDRVALEARHGRLLARPPENLAGKIEVHGLGIRTVPFEPVAVVGFVADLGEEGERMPPPDTVALEGVILPRMLLGACADPLTVLIAALRTVRA